MQKEALESFIEIHITSGYSKDQITQYLVPYGNSTEQINECFDLIQKKEKDTTKFVKDHLKQGFTVKEITDHLKKHQISETIIHKSIIDAISVKEQPFSLDKFIKTDYFKYAIPAIFTLLFVGLLIGLFTGIGEKKLLDVDVSILNEFARAGEDLKLNINAQNFGSKGRFDITARIELLNTNVAYEETFAIETSVSKQINIPLPMDLEDSDYTLQTTLVYGGDTEATSRLNFHINKARIVIVENEIPIIITNPLVEINLSNEINNSTNISINTSIVNNTNLPLEIIQNNTNITEIVNTSVKINDSQESTPIESVSDETLHDTAVENDDPDQCNLIQNIEVKDDCFMDISKNTEAKDPCFNIEKQDLKDACFVQVASKGDLTACEEVKKPEFQRMCDDIKLNTEKS